MSARNKPTCTCMYEQELREERSQVASKASYMYIGRLTGLSRCESLNLKEIPTPPSSCSLQHGSREVQRGSTWFQ